MTNKGIKEPRWGAKDRGKKAQAILQTMAYATRLPLEKTQWLDIGCGSGGIAACIAPQVQSVLGIDAEPWSRWDEFQEMHANLHFVNESIENLSCADNSFDVIVCNQVYEHVQDPQYLIAEIYRILRPGGYCYFAGPNLLFPIEPHVFWPFIHWLPRELAIKLLKVCGSKAELDAYSVNYWTLKKWLNKFHVTNAVPYIIKNPSNCGRSQFFWQIISFIPWKFIDMMTWISPGFVFILRKPMNSSLLNN